MNGTAMITGFEDHSLHVNGQDIAFSLAGEGPPVLLLHGFPQTRALWAQVAPLLAQRYSVVAADLRGYGDSSKPDGVAAMSFRNMGADQLALMQALGHETFHLIGHDRGGRTAHRLALDAPEAVASLTVMDIVPTHLLLSDLSKEVARAYYHWFFLSQPAPVPETLISADVDAFFHSCLTGWGGAGLADFAPEQLDAYRRAWRDPACIHTMFNDYRAAIDVDFALDNADLSQKVTCPALVAYGADGAMAQHYDMAAAWSPRLANMQTTTVPGGHFFVDQSPEATAAALLTFLDSLAA